MQWCVILASNQAKSEKYYPDKVKMENNEPKILVDVKKVKKTDALRNIVNLRHSLIYQFVSSMMLSNDSSRALLHLLFALPC